MTINDMLDAGIEIEGNVEVRCYAEEIIPDNYHRCEYGDISQISDDIRDMEILYMFPKEDTLVIEVDG